MPRPSLSADGARQIRARNFSSCVAGVDAPAFVERCIHRLLHAGTVVLSKSVAGVDAPAFVERSTSPVRVPRSTAPVSPGLMPRPSLSASSARLAGLSFGCHTSVAGVDAPAFVERGRRCKCLYRGPGVDGVDAPAFVERSSLRGTRTCRRRCVAGVDAPAFIERNVASLWVCFRQSASCRRG